MPAHNVTINQLCNDRAYLNVMDDHGHVGVWGVHSPAYLIGDGTGVYGLVVFTDQAWANEWLKENEEGWPFRIPMIEALRLLADKGGE